MRAGLSCASFCLFLFASPVFGYLILGTDPEPVIALKHQGSIYKVPCHETYIGLKALPRDPQEIFKNCEKMPNQKFEPVSEPAYYMSVSALYGLPTYALNEKNVLTLVTESALAAERGFRTQKNEFGAFTEEILTKLGAAHEDIFAHLGPESDRFLGKATAKERHLGRLVLEAFTPYFSDGKITVHLADDYKPKENGSCHPGTGQASVQTIYKLLSEPRLGQALLDWTIKVAPQPHRTPFQLSTWLPTFEKQVNAKGKTEYGVRTAQFWLELSSRTLEWLEDNRSEIVGMGPQESVLTTPGFNDIFVSPAYVGQIPKIPSWCLSRWVLKHSLFQEEAPAGELGLAEIARRYNLSVEKLWQWAANDAEVETLLARAYVQEAPFSEDPFREQLLPALDRLLGRNLFSNWHSEQIKLAEIAFSKVRETEPRRTIEFVSYRLHEVTVYLAHKFENEWGYITGGVFKLPPYGNLHVLRGPPKTVPYYYAFDSEGDIIRSKPAMQLVIQTEAQDKVAIQADREPTFKGERKALFRVMEESEKVELVNVVAP